MPLSNEDEQRHREYLRQSHENAIYQAFQKGKGVLPAGKHKGGYYSLYGAAIFGGIAVFFTRSIAHFEMTRIIIFIVAAAVGFFIGGIVHDSLFVVDESWESPKVDQRR